MNAFSEAMRSMWSASDAVFGEECLIGTYQARCVPHDLSATDGIENRKPGKQLNPGGQVVVRRVDWEAAQARKGTILTIGRGLYRVLNDPDYSPASSDLLLTVGPVS